MTTVPPIECQKLFCHHISEIEGFKYNSDGGSKTRGVFTCCQSLKKQAINHERKRHRDMQHRIYFNGQVVFSFEKYIYLRPHMA